ncbi:hypothetical protein ACU8KH_00614 [Lachancea thermotolerans]
MPTRSYSSFLTYQQVAAKDALPSANLRSFSNPAIFARNSNFSSIDVLI